MNNWIYVAIIIGAILYVREYNPDTYEEYKNKVMGTESEEEEQVPKEVIEYKKVYGKPYNLDYFACTQDIQCESRWQDIENIQCNVETGECYTEEEGG